MNYRYFTQADFDAANPVCRVDDMDPRFMEKMDVARYHAGIPFIVNSAYRTVEHEKSKGREGTSSHTKGLAIDLQVTSSRERFIIIQALFQAGFRRVGLEGSFIHADSDDKKDPDVFWTY